MLAIQPFPSKLRLLYVENTFWIYQLQVQDATDQDSQLSESRTRLYRSVLTCVGHFLVLSMDVLVEWWRDKATFVKPVNTEMSPLPLKLSQFQSFAIAMSQNTQIEIFNRVHW